MADVAKGTQISMTGLFLGFGTRPDTDKDGAEITRTHFVFEGSDFEYRDRLPIHPKDVAEAKARYGDKANSVITVPVQLFGKFANASYQPQG